MKITDETVGRGKNSLQMPTAPLMMTDAGVTIFPDFYISNRVNAGTPNEVTPILKSGMHVYGSMDIITPYDFLFTGLPVVNRHGEIVFFAEAKKPSGGKVSNGVYLLRNGKILTVLEAGENAPGSGRFSGFSNKTRRTVFPSISSDGKHLAILAELDGGKWGVFRGEVGEEEVVVTRVAELGKPSPDGGEFIDFPRRRLAVNNRGAILFPALSSGYLKGLGFRWYFNHGDTDGFIRESNGVDEMIFNDRGEVLFTHYGYFGGPLGKKDSLAYGPVKGVRNIAVVGEAPPRGDGTFEAFKYPILDAAGNVVFTAELKDGSKYGKNHGVYQWTPGNLKTIMLMTDLYPAGSEEYDVIGSVAPVGMGVSSGQVHLLVPSSWYFAAPGPGMIARGNGSDLTRIIGEGDLLEGERVISMQAPFFLGGLGGLGGQGSNVPGESFMNARGKFAYTAYTEKSGFDFYAYSFAKTPEIALYQPAADSLKDGKSVRSFGSIPVGSGRRVRKFTIKNTGAAALEGITVFKSGKNARDFTIVGSPEVSLEPGESTTFQVIFHPVAEGVRRAVIRIMSNDKDERFFDIPVTGKGVK